MKKIMSFALAAMFAATAFAQNPDALKQVKKAKTFADAQAVIKANESSMSAAENAQAYNKCVDLLMNGINDAQNKFALGQQPDDINAFYKDLYNAFTCAMACDKYDIQPNEKGKVAPKFRKNNGSRLYNFRVHLINAGQDAYGVDKYDEAAQYLGAYCESGTAELFVDAAAENLKNQKAQAKLMGQNPDEIEADPYIGDVCRMAASAAFNANNKALALKYASMLADIPARTEEAIGYMRYFAQGGLNANSTHNDSIQVLNELEALCAKYPNNGDLFADVASFYGMLGQKDKQEALIDKELQRDSKSFAAWALRGNNLMMEGQTDPTKLDEAIVCFKNAVAVSTENPSIFLCLGTCYTNKAASADNDDAVLANLREAMPFLEKARELDPQQERCRWAYMLYSCYYNIYGENDARTKEIAPLAGM